MRPVCVMPSISTQNPKPSQLLRENWQELAPRLNHAPPPFYGEVLDGMAESGFTVDLAYSLAGLVGQPAHPSRLFQNPDGKYLGITQNCVALTPKDQRQQAATNLGEMASVVGQEAPERAAIWRAVVSYCGVSMAGHEPPLTTFRQTMNAPGNACSTADDQFFGAIDAYLRGNKGALTIYQADDAARTPLIAQKSRDFGEITGLALRSFFASTSRGKLEVPPGFIVGLKVPGSSIVHRETVSASDIAGVQLLRLCDVAFPPDSREARGEYYALGSMTITEITNRIAQRLPRRA